MLAYRWHYNPVACTLGWLIRECRERLEGVTIVLVEPGVVGVFVYCLRLRMFDAMVKVLGKEVFFDGPRLFFFVVCKPKWAFYVEEEFGIWVC